MMRRIALACLAGIIALVLISTVVGQTDTKKSGEGSDSRKLTWLKYDKALELAEKENKHVMVFFTTEWCKFCKEMEKKVFTDPEIHALMSEDLILAEVWGDHPKSMIKVEDKDGNMIEVSEKAFAKSLGVTAYPITLFLKPDGSPVIPAILKGYEGARPFGKRLKYVISKSYETLTLTEFVNGKG